MANQSKLRMSVGLFYPIAILSCYIIAIIEWGIRSGLVKEGFACSQFPLFTYYICGCFFFAMGIFQWFRYRLWIYPVLGTLVALLCIQAPGLISSNTFFSKGTYFITFFVTGLFVILNWRTFYGQERYEINSRRLFKLAGEGIIETADGFTGRPFSAGEIEASHEEMLGFARFLEGKYISKVFHEEQLLYLAFSLNKSLLATSDPKEVSHVTIAPDSSLSVFIAETDYRQYRKTYNFNQLCQSLGEVFKRFMVYYKQGLESRIITEIKTAR